METLYRKVVVRKPGQDGKIEEKVAFVPVTRKAPETLRKFMLSIIVLLLVLSVLTILILAICGVLEFLGLFDSVHDAIVQKAQSAVGI